MSSNSFFNQKAISNIKKVHKGFLWVATGILIISLLLGIVLIFVDTKSEMFGKAQGTFSILALAAFICVNNLIRIEKGNKPIQAFAMIGFLANIVWLVMGILMIWGVFEPVKVETSTMMRTENAVTRTYEYQDRYNFDTTNEAQNSESLDAEYETYNSGFDSDYDYDYDSDYDYDYDYYYDYDDDDDDDYYVYEDDILPPSTEYSSVSYTITMATKVLIVVVSIASIGFWVSNILAIKNTVSAVRALKFTAIICQVFSSVFVIVLVFMWPTSINQDMLKWLQLYGLTSSGFAVMALAAWIISITHKNFDAVPAETKPEKVGLVSGAGKVEEKKDVEENVVKADKVEKELPVAESVVEVEKVEEEMSAEPSVSDDKATEENQPVVEDKSAEAEPSAEEVAVESEIVEEESTTEPVIEMPGEEKIEEQITSVESAIEVENSETEKPTEESATKGEQSEKEDSGFEGFSNNDAD